MTARRVEVDGIGLHVEDEGRGPPVLFGHGLLFSAKVFEPHARALAADHRVLRLDFRAHGRSGIPRGAWTIRDHARDYLAVLDALGVDRAVIVGHSMGGMAALHLALERPDRVRALALLDTSASAERPWRRLRYMTLASLAHLFGIRPWLLRQAEPVMFGPTFRRTRREVVEEWLRRAAEMNRAAVFRAVRAVAMRPSVLGRLSAIEAPALVVVGEEDDTTPVTEARAIAGRLPRARLEVLPRTGHMATVEQPEETIRLIRRFVEDISA